MIRAFARRLGADRPPAIRGSWKPAIGVGIVFLALWSLFIHSHISSFNDASRMASVEALVKQGTWAIDDTRMAAHTADIVKLNGHTYSDKPPVLSFIAAGLYAVLHRVFGLELLAQTCDPHASACYCFALLCPQQPDWAYYWLTWALMAVPSALALALFYRLAVSFSHSNALALILTAVLGLGTTVVPYSLVINNHIPTTACLILGLYALLQSTGDAAHSRRWLAVAGFAASLAFTIELQAGVFLVFFLADAVLHHRRQAWPYLLGALPPLVLMAALDWWILGDPFPPMLHPSGYAFEGSQLNATIGGLRTATNVPQYVFAMLVGDRGVFSFVPVMLWVVAAVVARLRDARDALWSRAVIVGAACVALTVYFGGFTESFGGEVYGPMWFTAMMPLLFLFAASPALYRTPARRLIFGGLSALSIYAAWLGALDPWRAVPPPLWLTASAPVVERPPALTAEQIAAIPYRLDVSFEGKARLIGYAVSQDPVRPGDHLPVVLYWQALAPMNEDYIVFIHLINSAQTLTAQFDAPRGVTNQTTRYWNPGDVFSDTYTVSIPVTAFAPDHVTVAVGLYRPASPRLRVTSGEGHPLGDSVQLAQLDLLPEPGVLAHSTQVNFGNQIVLLGYDLNQRVIRPGETVSVTLYWQAYVPPGRDYNVFLQLADLHGEVIAANDGAPYTQPWQTGRWQLGQVMQEVRALHLPADTAPGLYHIQMGVFGSDERLPIITAEARPARDQLALVQVRVEK
jgi:hypothetical protein